MIKKEKRKTKEAVLHRQVVLCIQSSTFFIILHLTLNESHTNKQTPMLTPIDSSPPPQPHAPSPTPPPMPTPPTPHTHRCLMLHTPDLTFFHLLHTPFTSLICVLPSSPPFIYCTLLSLFCVVSSSPFIYCTLKISTQLQILVK